MFRKLISIKHFLLFVVLFLLFLFVHSWALLVWITAIFYFFVMFLWAALKTRLINRVGFIPTHLDEFDHEVKSMSGSKNYGTEKYLYLLFGIIFILVAIIERSLGISQIAINISDLKENPFGGVMHYLKLISYDFDFLWILGILGFCSSFFVIKNRKALVAIHSMFFSNLILLGFFVSVLQQRYFFHAYSFYLIYPAIVIVSDYLFVLRFF
jgi:hypothetical protein